MPRRISAEEAKRLGAVPVDAPRKMTAAEAEASGAVPIDAPLPSREATLDEKEQAGGLSVIERAARYLKSRPTAIADTAKALVSPNGKVAPSFANGRFGGVLPYLSAAIDTVPDAVHNPSEVPEKYAGHLGRIKSLYDKAEAEEPGANLLGALTTPNVAGKANASQRVLSAGFSGGVNSATHGGSVAGGVAGGAGLQMGLEMVRPGLGALGGRYAQRAEQIRATKAAQDAEEMLATRSGQYSQKVQDSNRALLNIKEALADPNTSPELKARAQAFLSSPEGAALAEQVGTNTLDAAPSKLAQMASLKAARDAAPADAAKATADYFSKSTLKEDVLPRVKNYAARSIPPLVADAAGSVMGGSKAIAAGALGAMTGAALGRPGTSLGNLLQKTPRFSARVFDTAGKAADAAAGVPLTEAPGFSGAAGSALQRYLNPDDENDTSWFTRREK